MLKPLIQAIPSKKINIHNREYLVYEPISQCGEFIRFYVSHVRFMKRIRTFGYIRDIKKRHSTFYQYLDKLVDEANQKLEAVYLGDRFRIANVDERVTLYKTKDGRIRVHVRHQCPTTFKAKRFRLHIGMEDATSDVKVANAVKLAGETRKQQNRLYNLALAEKRKQFRELVQRQVIERDATL